MITQNYMPNENEDQDVANGCVVLTYKNQYKFIGKLKN